MSEQLLIKNSMSDMRELSDIEILDLQRTIYTGVLLLGYYNLGDTPDPIVYNLKSTTTLDDGGSVIDLGKIKLSHDFNKKVDVSYFGCAEGEESSEKIQKAIDYLKVIGGGDIIISKNYKISEIILSKENVNIYFINGAKLTITDDKNGIDINKNVIIDSPYIVLENGLNYTKSQLYCSGDKRIKTRLQRTVIRNAILYGNEITPMGNGLHFYSGAMDNEAVSFVLVDGLHAHGFDKAINLEQGSNPKAWVTSNIFNNIFLSANRYYFYNQGSDGNVITNIEFQPFGNSTQRQIYCSGDFNCFNSVVFWDIKNDTVIELTEESRSNTINVATGSSGRSLIDDGNSNRVVFNQSQYSINNRLIEGSKVSNAIVNNYLGYAEERNTVTASPLPTTYSINNAFRSTGVVRWENTALEDIIVQVEFPMEVFEIEYIEVVFNPIYTAKNVKVELFNNKTFTWITWINRNKNLSEYISSNKYQGLSTHSNNITKFRLTFSEKNNETVNRIELSYISLICKSNNGYNYINKENFATQSVAGIVKQSVAVVDMIKPRTERISPSVSITLAELKIDHNALVERFNLLVEETREMRTVLTAKLVADKNSGQQS